MSGCGAEAKNFEIDDKSIRLCLKGREWVGSETAPFPSVFKEGWRAAPGWFVKGRVASIYARAAILIFVGNHEPLLMLRPIGLALRVLMLRPIGLALRARLRR